MAKQIRLFVENGAIQADENGKKFNKGNFCVKERDDLMWSGSGSANDNAVYVVKFLRDGVPDAYDWPFSQPVDSTGTNELRVPTTGQLKTTLNPGEVLWKYEVTRDGAAKLDPMIIVREAKRRLAVDGARRRDAYTVGTIALLAGTLLGMLLNRR